jgi:hypothetical protein
MKDIKMNQRMETVEIGLLGGTIARVGETVCLSPDSDAGKYYLDDFDESLEELTKDSDGYLDGTIISLEYREHPGKGIDGYSGEVIKLRMHPCGRVITYANGWELF